MPGAVTEIGRTLPFLSVVPFAAWLLTIAVAPLAVPKFWESNQRKAALSLLFALPILILLISKGTECRSELLRTGFDYFSFIVLLASLFTVSGGILMTGDVRATPAVNTLILLIGSVLANLIGTTGASMVLIRPLLRINSERSHTGHTPVFFVFLVSNIGGLLTPLGDPPLFLGFLRDVPFFWTLRLFPMWATAVGLLLVAYYLYDHVQYRREPPSALTLDATRIEPIRVTGLLNFLFLLGILGSVLVEGPIHRAIPAARAIPVKELLMIAIAFASYRLTPCDRHEKNGFTFHPIIEVAVLFAGIFVTMVPALFILEARGGELGLNRPWQFFWLTGGLSSFLDNAPTYLAYTSAASGLFHTDGDHLNQLIAATQVVHGATLHGADFLAAISCGSVFMGANTYIGNGPNFMVKSIADRAGCKMPSFFGYMLYAGLILTPLYILLTVVFFV